MRIDNDNIQTKKTFRHIQNDVPKQANRGCSNYADVPVVKLLKDPAQSVVKELKRCLECYGLKNLGQKIN